MTKRQLVKFKITNNQLAMIKHAHRSDNLVIDAWYLIHCGSVSLVIFEPSYT